MTRAIHNMYSCFCGDQTIEDWRRNRNIETFLKRERQRMAAEIKVLLLGTGESGKSTIMKQMKVIHGGQHSLVDGHSLDQVRHIIYQNVVKGMKVLICAREAFSIPWAIAGNASVADLVSQADTKSTICIDYFRRYSPLLEALWRDSAIQTAFSRRNEFQLSDGFLYLVSNVKRISSEKYTPTTTDMLHSRVPTKAIHNYSVRIKNIAFVFVDVGGQRKQRVKWLHCLDNVTSVLFIVSSIEYDQQLVEDASCNRLSESLVTFEAVINSFFFQHVSFILFLNKMDLLDKKLKYIAECINKRFKAKNWNERGQHPIKTIKDYFDHFPTDADPTSVKDVQQFLLDLFKNRCHVNKQLYYHYTVAVDTDNIKHVFNDVKRTILSHNIQSLMLN